VDEGRRFRVKEMASHAMVAQDVRACLSFLETLQTAIGCGRGARACPSQIDISKQLSSTELIESTNLT
jgi:hypothetical protein